MKTNTPLERLFFEYKKTERAFFDSRDAFFDNEYDENLHEKYRLCSKKREESMGLLKEKENILNLFLAQKENFEKLYNYEFVGKEAYILFEQGKIKEANELIDGEEILDKIEVVNTNFKDIGENLDNEELQSFNIDCMLQKILLMLLDFETADYSKKAREYFEKIVATEELMKLNPVGTNVYIRYLAAVNDYRCFYENIHKVLVCYGELITKIDRPDVTEVLMQTMITFLLEEGEEHIKQKEFKFAEKSLQTCVKMQMQFFEEFKSIDRLVFMNTLALSAKAYLNLYNYKECESFCNTLKKQLENGQDDYKESSRNYYIIYKETQAKLYEKLEEWQKALKTYEEAIALYDFEGKIATDYENQLQISFDYADLLLKHDLDDAPRVEYAFEKISELANTLACENPYRYQILLAKNYAKQSFFERKIGCLSKAKFSIGTALDLLDGAARAEDADVIEHKIFIFNAYSNYLKEVDDYENAKNSCETALKYCQDLIKTKQKNAVHITLDTHVNLAYCHFNFEKHNECYEELLKAQQLAKKSVDEDFDEYAIDYANINDELATLLSMAGHTSDAATYFFNVSEIYKKICGLNPKIYANRLACTMYNLGSTCARAGDKKDAEEYYLEALYYYKELKEIGELTDKRAILNTCQNLFKIFALEDNKEKSDKYLSELIPEIDDYVEKYGDEDELFTAKMLHLKARRSYDTKDIETAKDILTKTLKTREDLINKSDENERKEQNLDLFSNYCDLGLCYSEDKNYPKAKSCYNKANILAKFALGEEKYQIYVEKLILELEKIKEK